MAQERKSSSSRTLVAAFDFGTTYSGYAYSFKSDWAKVHMNKWEGGQLSSFKAPTALLLNPDKSFNSFGFEAEKTYSEIATDGDEEGRTCKEYYFFHRFKMMLKTTLTQRVHRETMCKDENDREMEAMPIFTLSIKYLKDHLMKEIEKRFLVEEITLDDINFILTVPAIWDDSAKMFMREAAVKAGLPDKQLQIALEPEAASIYCHLMHFDAVEKQKGKGNWTREMGLKYMVVDLGGGTADITVHQLQENGTLAEVVPASGGDWGGTCVDEAYKNFLEDIFGKTVMKTFKYDLEYVLDYIEFWQNFEIKKREQVISKISHLVHLLIPIALTEIFKEQTNKKGMHDAIMKALIKESTHKNEDITSLQGKLELPIESYQKFFTPTIEKLVDHLSKMFREEVGPGVDVILMVGGFSECELVQEKLAKHFGNKRLVIPYQAGLAVLKGAVFFGHHKDLISRRVARYTYGIQTWPKFDKTRHSLHKKHKINGEDRCRDVFLKFITKGDPIEPGLKKSYIFKTLKQGEKILECGVFISNKKNPEYVDEEDCYRLGTLEVPLTNSELRTNMEIEESIIFGETEIRVTACNFATGKEHEIVFDLLSPKIKIPSSKR
ncbi:heat shock 70 kDa protein 12A-like [Saccostrea cucullata]|uniref:heat shock 70 kDa protein 12A-like n=1 Tax=Saccostrea cuccullata TaxID=36930 RepID=UPI002ED094DB